jgi:hypothetical protein
MLSRRSSPAIFASEAREYPRRSCGDGVDDAILGFCYTYIGTVSEQVVGTLGFS